MSGKVENIKPIEFEIVRTNDGADTIFSKKFGEHYHSTAGSLGESIYVYQKQALEYYLQLFPDKKQINIFEVGFGVGLNAFVTLIYALDKDLQINFYSIEKFPLQPADLYNFSLGDYQKYQPFFLQIHKTPWNQTVKITSTFSLTKIFADWTQYNLDQFLENQMIDIVYYDAFSYDTQPEMWTVEMFKKLFEKMSPGGVLTTYAAKGKIKQNLTRAGFFIERLKGAWSKRHMLRALKPKKGQNVVRFISISNLKFDNIPINPTTLDLAMKIYNKQIDPYELPPIKVMQLPTGQYLIRDGRHRAAAFKLNGLDRIKAYIFVPKTKQDDHSK